MYMYTIESGTFCFLYFTILKFFIFYEDLASRLVYEGGFCDAGCINHFCVARVTSERKATDEFLWFFVADRLVHFDSY